MILHPALNKTLEQEADTMADNDSYAVVMTAALMVLILVLIFSLLRNGRN